MRAAGQQRVETEQQVEQLSGSRAPLARDWNADLRVAQVNYTAADLGGPAQAPLEGCQ